MTQPVTLQQVTDQVRAFGDQQYAQGVADGKAQLPRPYTASPTGGWPVVKYSSLYRLGDATLMNTIARLPQPSCLLMDRAGRFEFKDFAQARDLSNSFGYGLYHPNLKELVSSFEDRRNVTLAMTPHSSTVQAPKTGTNNYALLRVGFLGNIAVEGTDQGHDYNGWQPYQATSDMGGNVEVTGVQGSANNPPGETFGINLFQAVGNPLQRITLRNVEVSGIRRSDGRLVGASPIGWNTCRHVDVHDADCHDTLAGMPTFWDSTWCATYRLRSARCGSGPFQYAGAGINHEESTYIVHHDPTLLVDQPGVQFQHLQVNSAAMDCDVRVKGSITYDHPAYAASQDVLAAIWPNYSSSKGSGQKVTGNLVSVEGHNIRFFR